MICTRSKWWSVSSSGLWHDAAARPLDDEYPRMKYKGYLGKVEFNDEAGTIHGEIINTRDVITFQGKSVAELNKASGNPWTITSTSAGSRRGAGQAAFRQKNLTLARAWTATGIALPAIPSYSKTAGLQAAARFTRPLVYNCTF